MVRCFHQLEFESRPRRSQILHVPTDNTVNFRCAELIEGDLLGSLAPELS
jgi:hypothetical protein